MPQKIQILRTITNPSPTTPPPLDPGEMSVELGGHTKFWIGAVAGSRLLLSTDPDDAPVAGGNYVRITGSTMTGQLVTSNAGDPAIRIGGPAASNRRLGFSTNNLNRWTFGVDSAAEGGGNAGSNLVLHSYPDAGTPGTQLLFVNRATGSFNFQTGMNFGSALAPGGSADLSRHIALFGTTFGIGITTARINYVAGGSHVFMGGTTDVVTLNGQGVTINSATGDVLLARAPTLDLHAASKLYVDNSRGAISDGISISGTGTSAGTALAIIPAPALDVATGTRNNIAVTPAGLLNGVLGDPVGLLPTPIKTLVPAIAELWDGLEALSGNLIFGGQYSIINNEISATINPANPFAPFDGQGLPPATGAMRGWYLIVVDERLTPPWPANVPVPPGTRGYYRADWLVVDATPSWVHLMLGYGQSQILAADVGVAPTPPGMTSDNVQDAIAELNTLKVNRAGDTMVGRLTMGATGAGITIADRFAASTNDVTQHIQLYAPTIGFGVTGGRLNYIVGGAQNHWFRSNNVDRVMIGDVGLQMQAGTNLILAQAPTSALHAATMAYADSKLALTGGVLSGALTLSGPPTLDLHAASKAYVDAHTAGVQVDGVSIVGDGAGTPLEVQNIDCGSYTLVGSTDPSAEPPRMVRWWGTQPPAEPEPPTQLPS